MSKFDFMTVFNCFCIFSLLDRYVQSHRHCYVLNDF